MIEIAQRTTKILEGVNVKITGCNIEVTGPKGTVTREVTTNDLVLKVENNEFTVAGKNSRKKTKAMVGTIFAHFNNMMKGVTDGFTYKLKVVYSHFPMTVKVEGNKIRIDNFLGAKSPRFSNVIDGVKVQVKAQDVEVSGIDREFVSQTAANIEQATRIIGFDSRVFQDGIYITSKGD
ncbi:MAG: 50S ribosomal protein L6 [Candidatus Diapherotrites archaeon]|nr:50S ribosomal protein L6 [Candidatus Diapherotrites archaeon]